MCVVTAFLQRTYSITFHLLNLGVELFHIVETPFISHFYLIIYLFDISIFVLHNANGEEGRRLYCFSLEQICRELRRNITGKQRVFYWAKIYFLEARTGRRQPKTATFTRCTSTSTRLSPTSAKSSPTSSLPLSVMQYQCAQTNLISSVFSLYQSLPKQHRIQKEGKIVLSSSRTHSHQTLLTELVRL